MSRPFKLKAVLRHLDKGLLAAYLEKRGMDNPPEVSDGMDENEVWDEFVQGLDAGQSGQLETDLRDVNDMATEDGLLALLEIAKSKNVHPQKEIEELAGFHDKALHFLIRHPNVFDIASISHHVDGLKARAERFLKKRSADFVEKNSEILAKTLSQHLLATDGRGRECAVNVYRQEDRVCFIAYPEDFAKSPLCYEGRRLKRLPLRPTFEIVFLYYPHTGKVELSAKGGPKRQMGLFRIFNQVVLEDQQAVAELEKTYRLEKFLDGNLKLPTLAEDEVEYVRLQKLRLSHRFEDYRITLELKQANGVETMKGALGKFHVQPSAFSVVQAEVKMKFPGRGRKGSVTIQLSYPDKCNLNDSPNHLKAKKYLEEWGLVNRKPTEGTSRRPGRELPLTAV
jgi:hypothetical protein